MHKPLFVALLLVIIAALAVYIIADRSNEPLASVSPTPTQQSPTVTPFASANVKVTSPLPNTMITSPLIVHGEARGNWFFEASFPIQILDAQGKVITNWYAQANGDWMTSNFVPFTATISFTKPTTGTGTIIFHKDNPSGLPQNDASVSFPVRF